MQFQVEVTPHIHRKLISRKAITEYSWSLVETHGLTTMNSTNKLDRPHGTKPYYPTSTEAERSALVAVELLRATRSIAAIDPAFTPSRAGSVAALLLV